MESIKVIHVMRTYLEITQNWLFSLIINIPDTEPIIIAESWTGSDFKNDKIRKFELPVKQIYNPKKYFFIKFYNRFITFLLRFVHILLKKKYGKIHILHSHFAPIGWQYSILAKQLKIPHVVSFYGYDYQKLPYTEPVWKKRYNHLFKEADMFLCEGQNGIELLKKMGCPHEKIRLARLGITPDNIQVWKRNKNPKQLNLLQIASFRKKKGYEYTIDAFLKALEKCPNMTLTLIGNGELDDYRETQIKKVREANVPDKVFFKDAVDYKQLYRTMKDYHVFIHPSCYAEDMDCEGGAPVVLLDAQATGMPIISTYHCDIPDLVIDKKTGLLSPEKNIESLINSIQFFYSVDQTQYDYFSENARTHVENNYNIENNAKEVNTLYRKLLSND